MFTSISKYLLQKKYLTAELLLTTFIFTALTICIYPEFSTFNFWFSSAVTYQLPVILTQCEIAFLIILIQTQKKAAKNIFSILLPVLVFIITGFNEVFIAVQLFILAAVFFLDASKRISKTFWFAALFLFAAGVLIVLLSPGSQVRAEKIEPKSNYLAIAAILYHMGEVCWTIFKTPFTWVALCCCFVAGNENKNIIALQPSLQKLYKKKWLLPCLILLFPACCIAPAVFALKGGILPDRYLNVITLFTLILLIVYSFITGATVNESVSFSFLSRKIKILLLYSCIIIALLCNTQVIDAYKSLIAAPLYNNILTERENILSLASASPTKTAVIKNYGNALNDELKNYPASPKTFSGLVQQKPKLLFVTDDLSTVYSLDVLKKYYRLDSIIVK